MERLEVQAYAPAQVWQRFDGERVGHPWGGAGEVVYPRCAALGVRMRVVKYGLVDNISPALETVFRLLGSRGDGVKRRKKRVVVVMRLEGEYPGQGNVVSDGEQCPESAWTNLDLPNLVEHFCRLYCASSVTGELDVEIVWCGSVKPGTWIWAVNFGGPVGVETHLKNMEVCGWDVKMSSMDEGDFVGDDRSWQELELTRGEWPTYELRRQPLEGELMGCDANRWSAGLIGPRMEEWHFEGVTGWYF